MWHGSNGQKRLVLLRTRRYYEFNAVAWWRQPHAQKTTRWPPHRYRAQTLERRWVAGRFGKTLRWRPNPASSISEQHKRKKHMLASLKLTASLHLKRWDPKRKTTASNPTINFQGWTLGFRWRVPGGGVHMTNLTGSFQLIAHRMKVKRWYIHKVNKWGNRAIATQG